MTGQSIDERGPRSTHQHLEDEPPAFDPGRVVSRFLTYPDQTGRRVAEGGLRTRRRFKRSRPELPLVTVITVCLDSARTLETAIRSVLEQDYRNVEYIVVDGASKDDTLTLLRRYDGAIDYWVSEPDAGLYQAMNKGLALACGEFVLILNSDDWYAPDCISTLVRQRQACGADLVSGLAHCVDVDGRPLNPIRPMPFDAAIRLRMPLRHETMLVPAALYNRQGGYDEQYRVIADFKFTLGLFESGCTHSEVPRVLMSFRNSGVSSRELAKLQAERARLLREQFDFLDAAEIDVLAEHGRLTPEGVRGLVQRYPQQRRLGDALRQFVLDQKTAGARRWLDFDPRVFVAPEAPPAPAGASPTAGRALRVVTLCSMDHGGAGTGTQRRVEALRRRGVDVSIHSLVVNSNLPYVKRLVPSLAGVDTADQNAVWQAVREKAIEPARRIPGFRASELFSLPESVVDFRDLKPTFDGADIVHLHWVVGMLDHDRLGEVLGDRPVMWTLADMNAFTGGCHYSEGCDGYKRECRACPLLGGTSDIAHEAWKRKKAAYARLRNLHIICPSKWIAERVAASSLLGDRPIHLISNAFPIERFRMTNKTIARIRLGLPLDKKLVLSGADSLGNKRKGGAQLQKALALLNASKRVDNVEIVLFGNSGAGLPLPSRPLGYIGDDRQLALVYSAADVFVSASDEDSGPMTVGESMLCGTPVVAFAVGIALEMIQHMETGYNASPRNAAELANGILWALEVDERRAIERSLRCRMFAERFHDPDVAVAKHLKVYEEAVTHG